jgi:hypothetical protein
MRHELAIFSAFGLQPVLRGFLDGTSMRDFFATSQLGFLIRIATRQRLQQKSHKWSDRHETSRIAWNS